MINPGIGLQFHPSLTCLKKLHTPNSDGPRGAHGYDNKVLEINILRVDRLWGWFF